MAPLSPWWASLTTRRTPPRPRATSPRRKASQKAPPSLGPTSSPSTSRSPVAVTPMARTTAIATPPAVVAHLHERRVEPDVGGGPLQAPGAGALHLGVQGLAHPRDLALGDL